jgi:hypothetical protein
MRSTPFLQFEHPLTSDVIMDIQDLAALAERDERARKALDDICEIVAAELSAARERDNHGEAND